MRKVILVIIGLIILCGASYVAYILINAPKEDLGKKDNISKPIAVDTVTNRDIPIIVKTNGVAEAVQKFEIFSEVEGVLNYSSKDFRAGQFYKQGQVLLKINNEEFRASVISAKSEFFNLLVALMPDIKIDYPKEFEAWEKYLDQFDVQKPLAQLPKHSRQLRYFITGRGILTSYFNIKNLESRLNKFTIRAPFDGVLTESSINLGTLVRPGQRLGEFISPSIYEVQIALQKSMIPFINVGDTVQLKNLDAMFSATGIINRINSQVEAQTQTIQVFVQTKDENIKEGLYLQAEVKGQTIKNAYAVSRSLLNNEDQLFIVKDSILDFKNVKPLYFTDERAIVRGLENGDIIMTSNLSSAYPGMLVKAKN